MILMFFVLHNQNNKEFSQFKRLKMKLKNETKVVISCTDYHLVMTECKSFDILPISYCSYAANKCIKTYCINNKYEVEFDSYKVSFK